MSARCHGLSGIASGYRNNSLSCAYHDCKVDGMQATSFIGAFVNVLRVPEKWFHSEAAAAQGRKVAGRFDYWLNSHQIMHIMVTIGIINLFWGANDDYLHWEASQGFCPVQGL